MLSGTKIPLAAGHSSVSAAILDKYGSAPFLGIEFPGIGFLRTGFLFFGKDVGKRGFGVLSKKKLLLATSLSLLMGVVAILAYLWLVLLSPFNYEYPEHMAAPPSEGGYQRVFVYGTLRYAPVRWIVMGRAGAPEPHTLQGYTKTALDIRPDPEGEVEGFLLKVTDEELRRLDRYERLGVRYLRTRVSLEDGREAWVYQLAD